MSLDAELTDDPQVLSEAIPLYYGVGMSPFPRQDASRLQRRYGPDDAETLVARITAIGLYLDSLVPDWSQHDLWSATAWAMALVRREYPLLDDRAIEALGWSYSYGWK